MKLLSLLLLVSGCVEPLEDRWHPVEAPGYRPPDCPYDECGMNTGSMGDKFWHEVDLDHTPNAAGVIYTGVGNKPAFVKNIDVSADNRLILVDVGGVEVTGQDIVGTHIRLAVDGKLYILKVLAKHLTASYWSYNTGPFWTYTLGYKLITDPGDSFLPLCKSEALGVDASVASDAVVFRGERYDAATKEITGSAGTNWINVACLGSAPAKLFMTRHTVASQDPAHLTTPAERQTMLDAFTGNYCGDGRSFTHTGEPIRLRDDRGFFPEDSPWSWSVEFTEKGLAQHRIRSYDAVWGADGATCIDTPRLEFSTTDDPDIRDDIGDWCESLGRPRPPRCSSRKGQVLVDWDTAQTHILTANPLGS